MSKRQLVWVAIVTWVDDLGRTRHSTCQGSLYSCWEYGWFYQGIGRQVDYSVHASSHAAWDRIYSVVGV